MVLDSLVSFFCCNVVRLGLNSQVQKRAQKCPTSNFGSFIFPALIYMSTTHWTPPNRFKVKSYIRYHLHPITSSNNSSAISQQTCHPVIPRQIEMCCIVWPCPTCGPNLGSGLYLCCCTGVLLVPGNVFVPGYGFFGSSFFVSTGGVNGLG